MTDMEQRLVAAEAILSDLATGRWVAILDDNDDPVREKMGQRVIGYWQAVESQTPPPHDNKPKGTA